MCEGIINYIDTGMNIVPTIHVSDLAQTIQCVIYTRPNLSYLIATDESKNTQKEILESIASAIGASPPTSISITQLLQNDYLLPLQGNINLENSKSIFDENIFHFNWKSKGGILLNITSLINEFKSFRGQRPLRVICTGPPVAGKTYYSDFIAQKYKLPHLKIKDILDESLNLQNAFGEKIKNQLAEIKAKMVEEQEAIAKKKKGMVVDHDKIIPKFTNEMIYECYLYKINQPAMLIRGFVIDG